MSYERAHDTTELTEEEWLEKRREGIGGSDAGIVLGLNPFESPLSLYAKKRGETPIDTSGSKATEWGHKLESTVADHFAETHDTFVENVNSILKDTMYDFMRANPDRRITSQFLEQYQTPGILEIKTTREMYAPLWDDKVPPYVYAQLQHYLYVTGYEWGYVAVLIGKDEYRDYFFERDDEFIQDTLLPECRRFWESVQHGDMPEPQAGDSGALDDIYDDPEDDTVEIDDDEVAELLEVYDKQKESLDELEDSIDEIKAKLKDQVGNHTKAIVHTEDDERTLSYPIQSRKFPDKDAIEEDYPELIQDGEWASDYANKSEYRTFRIY